MQLKQRTTSTSRLPRRLRLKAAVASFHNDELGQDLVEYALIAGFIGLAAVTSAHGVAVSVSSAINIVSSELTSAI